MGFIDIVLSPISAIFKPFIVITETIINLVKLLVKIVLIIPKLFETFMLIMQPTKLLKDIFYGITIGLKTILFAVLDILFGKLTTMFNINTEVNSKNDKDIKTKSAVCAKPNLLTFILLVLCPPLAIFTQQGLKGLFHVLVTAFLTCIYYFPGLIYASLILL